MLMFENETGLFNGRMILWFVLMMFVVCISFEISVKFVIMGVIKHSEVKY